MQGSGQRRTGSLALRPAAPGRGETQQRRGYSTRDAGQNHPGHFSLQSHRLRQPPNHNLLAFRKECSETLSILPHLRRVMSDFAAIHQSLMD